MNFLYKCCFGSFFYTVKSPVENPVDLSALLPLNDLVWRVDLESDSNEKNATLKHKVDEWETDYFLNLPAFPESNKLSFANLILVAPAISNEVGCRSAI